MRSPIRQSGLSLPISGVHRTLKNTAVSSPEFSSHPRGRGSKAQSEGEHASTLANKEEAIFAQARDVYDRTSRSHYKNGKGQDDGEHRPDIHCRRYVDVLLGANSTAVNSAPRFITIRIIDDDFDEEMQDAILYRVINKQVRNMSFLSSDGQGFGQASPDMVDDEEDVEGISRTWTQAKELASLVTIPEDDMFRLMRLSQFVALMRARPSKKQSEHIEVELANRLSEQYSRFLNYSCMVLNKRLC